MVRKGFTLIELLIVIGIIAILAAAVVLTLNPAELLRQSRDSTRISDLTAVKSALALYLADVTSPSMGDPANCYTSLRDTTGLAANCGGRFAGGVTQPPAAAPVSDAARRAVDNSGWIKVAFTSISSGSPLPSLPVDPSDNTTYFYAYRNGGTGNTQYELNANLESVKFADDNPGATDTPQASVEETDGGNAEGLYEVGTYPGLSL
jgi:prepilin-type N-terminal cleavage/methylation domain-containing protein